MEKLSVLVAEDNDVIRTFVCSLLSQEFRVVAAVGDGEQLVEAAIVFAPDVIVSDIAMPSVDGLLAREQLICNGLRVSFVFMTLLEMVKFPANLHENPVGYVHKLDLHDELKFAVWAVAGGSPYFSKSFHRNSKHRDLD